MFREVRVYEIREVLRLWVRGEGLRSIERLAGMDRKTVRRYVGAAVDAGLDRDGGEDQLNDVLLASICERVRPHRPDGRGAAWGLLVANHDQLKAWLVDDSLTVVKAGELLARRGTVVPERTLHRYALDVLGVGRSARGTTVRVADGEPGQELQIDFGKMGLIDDPDSGRRRVVQALIFTACFSRHCFVWLSFTQTSEAVIAGCEAAWTFFGGIFKVLIPDNMSSVIDKANPTEPRFNQAFVEYAQARGFLIDPARVRTPTDKPRVERQVPFVRNSSPVRPSSTSPTRSAGPRCGAGSVPGCGPMGPRSFARPSTSPSRKHPISSAPLRRPTTCRSTRRPRSTVTTTSRWPRRSIRSPVT